MKKIALAILVIAYSMTSHSQILNYFFSRGQLIMNTPEHVGEYLMPPCIPVDSLFTGYTPSGVTQEHVLICGYNYMIKIAQPYYVDSCLSLKGLSALLYNKPGVVLNYPCLPPWDEAYLQIHQPLGNVLASFRWDTIDTQVGTFPAITYVALKYQEFMLDTAIFIADTFYIVATFRPEGLFMDPKHEGQIYACRQNGILSNLMSTMDRCDGLPVYALKFDDLNAGWISILDFFPQSTGMPLYILPPHHPTMYLFPIIDTSYSLTLASVETEAAIVDTIAQTITLPLNVTEFGNPVATQLGLVYGTDSASLYLATATNVPMTINTNNSYYTHTLSASDVQCSTNYYYRAYIMSYGQLIWGETKKFVYQSASGSLIDILSSEVAATLSPNPADNEITITTAIPIQKVEITNATGQKVYEQSLMTSSVRVNTSKFSSGSYIATIHTEKGMVKKQFVVK